MSARSNLKKNLANSSVICQTTG